jgi:hypothetical protein
MIVKGPVHSLSLAVYGTTVSQTQGQPEGPYEPSILPTPSLNPLHSGIDVANTKNPLQTAQSLLSLIPEAPPLSLVIRLVFCMKPYSEDWDHPDFPYLYSKLEDVMAEPDLNGVVEGLQRPISNDTTDSQFAAFADMLDRLLDAKVFMSTLTVVRFSPLPRLHLKHGDSRKSCVSQHLNMRPWGRAYL